MSRRLHRSWAPCSGHPCRRPNGRTVTARPRVRSRPPDLTRSICIHSDRVATSIGGKDGCGWRHDSKGPGAAVSGRASPRTASARDGGQRPADVLVIFGITGDLAKVMTFNSLYRLEARGLLDCPIVGVAFDDWSVDDLRKHARKAIQTSSGKRPDPKVFNR